MDNQEVLKKYGYRPETMKRVLQELLEERYLICEHYRLAVELNEDERSSIHRIEQNNRDIMEILMIPRGYENN